MFLLFSTDDFLFLSYHSVLKRTFLILKLVMYTTKQTRQRIVYKMGKDGRSVGALNDDFNLSPFKRLIPREGTRTIVS